MVCLFQSTRDQDCAKAAVASPDDRQRIAPRHGTKEETYDIGGYRRIRRLSHRSAEPRIGVSDDVTLREVRRRTYGMNEGRTYSSLIECGLPICALRDRSRQKQRSHVFSRM